ncbi:MAG TPA: ATP-binding protein [Solirubrobacteraceae bacterium]
MFVIALTISGWLVAGGLALGRMRARGRLVAVARAAHEVRGPLFAARLALHALGGGAAEVARVAAVDVELARAALAVEDLAGAPRGRRAPARLELVDLAGVVRASAPAWRALVARHGARLALELPAAPARVRGDRLRLAQACANLVANAAEHGGGLVRVAVLANGGRVRVEVRDDGPGLPAPVAALAAAARGRHSRRGHGLAVVAALAGAHGGRLAAAPARAGARVVLELPAAGAPAPGGEAPPAGLRRLGGMKRRVRRRRTAAGQVA